MGNKLIKTVIMLAVVFASVWCLTFLTTGCTSDLTGEVNANRKPTVEFTNIPPAGQTFSASPVIHWVGKDIDGQVAYFRFRVATVPDMGSLTPAEYILTVDSASWTYLMVDLTALDANPQSNSVVPMTADLSDPVRNFVPQYVFLQAFDEEGLGSDIVFRLFSRNDNPPQTAIFSIPSRDLPFVNAQARGGIITGVKLRWLAEDPIDHPSDPPPFDFEWKLYGPYDDSIFSEMQARFVAPVFVTVLGDIFEMGDTIIRCDTTVVGGNTTVACDTFVVTDSLAIPAFGDFEDKLFIEDPAFANDTAVYNKLVDSSWNFVTMSTWVKGLGDTIYDVYRNQVPPNASADTTIEMNFLFWLRSRDDALVPDLVPAFKTFRVIDPRYERDVAVLDFTTLSGVKAGRYVSTNVAKRFWFNAVKRWNPSALYDTLTDTTGPGARKASPDYFVMQLYQPGIGALLKHKVLILYNEDYGASGIVNVGGTIYKAVDAGVNVWLTMRAPLTGGIASPPNFLVQVPPDYSRYFGVTGMVYSGWGCFAVGECTPDFSLIRIDDFMGGISLNPDTWPNVDVDTALLRTRILWDARFDLGYVGRGLPEVDWSQRRTPGTEALYLYRSYYGASHPQGFAFTFEGSPVAHRLNSGFYRTVHFNFTPLVMDSVQMQIVVDSVLNWLYDANLSSPTSSVRYPEARIQQSIEEARSLYLQRVDEGM